jgi:hypothetical protein
MWRALLLETARAFQPRHPSGRLSGQRIATVLVVRQNRRPGVKGRTKALETARAPTGKYLAKERLQ